MSVDGYLARLGVSGRPAPTLETLVDLHHRHLDAVPYDNLSIMLAAPTSADPAETLVRIAAGGNAGYCFHHNGAVELVLRGLGFDVERRPGSMLAEVGSSGLLDHLVLVVSGLPTPSNPDGRWWPDLGFGDAFRDPLPLREGVHRQGSFVYRIARLTDRGWTFLHDPAGSFSGAVVGRPGVAQSDVDANHARLSTPPDGHFTRLLVVQRRDQSGAETVRGIQHFRTGAGAFRRDLRSYDDWRAVLLGLGVSLTGVDDDALRALHRRMALRHDDWLALDG
ncbi:Arylamine N-acetyltransferase [Nocardioides terrae]|uniref:Arylamine N-acetyltransferase n=1 Tax=Nocardioides terrae TaxID=574651 RepID=A0A1I1G8Y9_9ACTN|nr:arylamine N-acetyltransferase [Nocardioides terrae]SFC05803.1 Arylamine N-acetyltransferase [Nocardioides terrae]